MRILFWNIMHGGGKRAGAIVNQILDWQPDIVALAEFRGTAPSRSIAGNLRDAGFIHQLSTVCADEPKWNALFLASRNELTRVRVEGAPMPDSYWLLAYASTEPTIHLGVVHAPWSIYLGRLEYYRALLKVATDWQLGPGILIGDTNTGLTGLDEETNNSMDYKDTFMNPIQDLGWRDMFRAFHPDLDAPTWFSRPEFGYRLDQAFVNAELQPTVNACNYDWGPVAERGKLSDHAALLLDIGLGI